METTKKPVLMLNGKFYHSYEIEELEEAKTRARKLQDKGNKVTLRWETVEMIAELEQELTEKLETIKESQVELEAAKERMANDAWTWGRANVGTIRKVNSLEKQITELRQSI